jgi:hypothetical protein
VVCAVLAGVRSAGSCESSPDAARGRTVGSDEFWRDAQGAASAGRSFHGEEWCKVSWPFRIRKRNSLTDTQ